MRLLPTIKNFLCNTGTSMANAELSAKLKKVPIRLMTANKCKYNMFTSSFPVAGMPHAL